MSQISNLLCTLEILLSLFTRHVLICAWVCPCGGWAWPNDGQSCAMVGDFVYSNVEYVGEAWKAMYMLSFVTSCLKHVILHVCTCCCVEEVTCM